MPTLSVTPPTAGPGTRFRVSGAGLAPGTTYRLVLLTPDGQETASSPVTTDTDGAWAADLVAEPGDPLGWYTAQVRPRDTDAVVANALFTLTGSDS